MTDRFLARTLRDADLKCFSKVGLGMDRLRSRAGYTDTPTAVGNCPVRAAGWFAWLGDAHFPRAAVD